MKLTVTTKHEVEITPEQLASGIMQYVVALTGIDDAGCDWATKDGITYVANDEWEVSTNPNIATLVDAANIIAYGQRFVISAAGEIHPENEKRNADA